MTDAALGALPDGFSERDVRIDQVRLVYARIRSSQWAMLLLAFAVSFVFRHDGAGILAWLAVQVVLKIAEWIELRWFAADAMIVARPDRFARRLILTQAVHAAAWSGLAVVALPNATPETFVLIFLIMAGIGSGSVSAYAPVLGVFTAYIAVMTGVLDAALLFSPSTGPARYAALFVTIYGGTMWAKAWGEAKESRRSILLAFTNTAVSRRLEREVERSQAAHDEAVAANAAKSRFLAAASHDLRQPLHALGLFLGLLERQARSDLQKEAVDNAKAAAAASSEMLDALLDLSRAEAGVIVAKARPFPLQDVLDRLARETASLAKDKGLSWRVRPTDALVQSDPALVQMILLNLVSNAVRYTERGGVLIGARRREASLLLEVWDTGIGIPSDQTEEVFREFHQLGNAERDRRKGLGLGLAIARRLAELLGAALTVHSREGRGSLFRLRLPLAADAPVTIRRDAPPDTPTINPEASGLRILVLDDDEAIRTGMRRLLSAWGHSCRAVETVEEAVAEAARLQPDLLICDFRLRGHQTGAQAAALIRRRLGRHVPAVLITGDTHPDRLREAPRAGLSVVHKPVSPEALAAIIQRVANAVTVLN